MNEIVSRAEDEINQKFPAEYFDEKGQFKAPEYVIRGIGRTTTVGRGETGLPITLEGKAVETQLEINQAELSQSEQERS